MSLALWSPEAWRLTQSICNTGGIFLPADFLVASLGKRASSWNRTGLLVAAADWNEDVWWRQAVIRQRSCSAFIYVLRKGRWESRRRDGTGLSSVTIAFVWNAGRFAHSWDKLTLSNNRWFSFKRILYARENKDSRRSLCFVSFTALFCFLAMVKQFRQNMSLCCTYFGFWKI